MQVSGVMVMGRARARALLMQGLQGQVRPQQQQQTTAIGGSGGEGAVAAAAVAAAAAGGRKGMISEAGAHLGCQLGGTKVGR